MTKVGTGFWVEVYVYVKGKSLQHSNSLKSKACWIFTYLLWKLAKYLALLQIHIKKPLFLQPFHIMTQYTPFIVFVAALPLTLLPAAPQKMCTVLHLLPPHVHPALPVQSTAAHYPSVHKNLNIQHHYAILVSWPCSWHKCQSCQYIQADNAGRVFLR